MSTFQQLVRKTRKLSKGNKNKYNRSPKLEGCPQKRGILTKVTTTKPKKPNSAVRKIAKVRLSTGKYIRGVIQGRGHLLQEHNVVLIKAGRIRDIPGIHYRLVRGPLDFFVPEEPIRRTGRSKYGAKFIRDPEGRVSKLGRKLLAAKGYELPEGFIKVSTKPTRIKKKENEPITK